MAVPKGKLELWPIECTLSRLLDERYVEPCEDTTQGIFRHTPGGVVSCTVLRTRRERDTHSVEEPERSVEWLDGTAETLDFGLDLVLHADHVAIVLGKLTDPQEALKRSTRFVAMYRSELAIPKWKLLVRGRPSHGHVDVSGTAHGLYRSVDGLILHVEHAVEKVGPMPALFPYRTPHDLWRFDLFVAMSTALRTHGFFEGAVKRMSTRVPKNHAWCLFAKVEEIEALSHVPVITIVVHGSLQKVGKARSGAMSRVHTRSKRSRHAHDFGRVGRGSERQLT